MIKHRILSFLFSALILTASVAGCKEAEPSNQTENSSSQPEPSVVVGEDLTDPENTENPNGTGTVVETDRLTVQEGKAHGIDVSKWQGKIDWNAVKRQGLDFAVIRVGYRAENGTIYKDPYADYNLQQADKAGLLIGVYFFSTATSAAEAEEEAKWTAEVIKGYPISYPVVYDCEGFTTPTSRMYCLDSSARTDNALAFLSYIESAGYDGMFYAPKAELENSSAWDTERIASRFRIWVAHYPADTYPDRKNPDYGGRYDMWQYTNMGKVSGVEGNTDMVISYFTRTKASPKANIKLEVAKPPVTEDSTYTAVNEAVTAKEIVNLRDSASTKSNIVGSLKNGETLTRTGVGSNGWSRLLLNGKTVYAISSYLTTDLSHTPPPQNDGYTPVNEQVTAKEVVNLRSAAGTSAQIVGQLKNGETLTRTAVGNNGWSRLLLNGQTVYAVSSYLTTDLSYKPPVISEPEPPSDGFTEVNEQVTAKNETNLRTVPSSKDSNTVVYTLKNGEYITRIGINTASGWSKLIYNGQTVYAITSYLEEKQ
ncbi:MAG: SH3 domain-containing protein [Clostridia bacterium]|nr:SH3 domain-containing protein [Clostridia bacterium]